jgi:dienelactone hydrolase
MCHPEVPAGKTPPNVSRDDVQVPLRNGEAMPALLARPDSGTGSGVLVVADIYGRSPFYEDLAGRLALAGFHALLPDFFFREGPLEERTMEAAFARRMQWVEKQALIDLITAIDWFKGQDGVHGTLVGTVGFCLGGTLVLGIAAERVDVATVCYYGFPAGSPASDNNAPAPLSVTEEMSGPILGFWGDQDAVVGMDNVAKLADLLHARGVEFDPTIYPGLGHGFMSASELDPDHEAYEVACDSWTKAIEFYRRTLTAA